MQLYPYQKAGAKWLIEHRLGLLADEMGLGKTPQAISAAKAVGATKILIVCPAVARANWVNELKNWYPELPAHIPYGLKDPLPIYGLIGAVVCSYDYATKNYLEITKQKWHALILDESHFTKNTEAKRARAIFGELGIVRVAHFVWALSGTPAPNYINDLWILLYSFGATSLSYEDFIKRYCEYYIFKDRLVVKGHIKAMIPEIKRMLEPVMLRRKMDEVLTDMPPISYHDLVVDPSSADLFEVDPVAFTYGQTKKEEMMQKIEYEKRLLFDIANGKGAHPDLITALQMSAKSISTLQRYSGLQRVKPVAELLKDELTSGAYEKIIIFGIHRDVIELLREQLSEWNPVVVYGGTDPKKAAKRIEEFQNDRRTRVFIGNIQSAGTAITLTAANEVLIIEHGHVPGDIAQAVKRAHRIGQKKPVRVRMVTLNDPVSIKITETVRRKSLEITEILG